MDWFYGDISNEKVQEILEKVTAKKKSKGAIFLVKFSSSNKAYTVAINYSDNISYERLEEDKNMFIIEFIENWKKVEHFTSAKRYRHPYSKIFKTKKSKELKTNMNKLPENEMNLYVSLNNQQLRDST